ncbi:MAG: IgA Peptidase M64 [Tannerellaceae bacterium]|jgi:hypothetical protein|nr:IgA Peptidase M64 [Tannerellaceae bacterium]
MIKRNVISFLLLCAGLSCASAQSSFDTWFEKKSLRIDFALSGNAENQQAALQQLREEPVWGGPVKNMTEPFDYGGYRVEVYDDAGGRLIYSRSFNTLFEEWRTTAQAGKETQSWSNSISVPFPRKEVRVVISGRNRASMKFSPLLELAVDPKSIFIDRGKLKNNNIIKAQYMGAPDEKVDLVFLAEGYTALEQEKFKADVEKFTESLFNTPPFDARRSDFNVWGVGLVSEESGTDVSGKGIFKHTALNSGYYTFGLDRYLTTPDMKSIRDAVWNVPCDAIFILVNADTYGGGGMYNFYAMGTANHPRTPVVFVHEFGHSFAGLADEYFSSEVAYDESFYHTSVEPWEPNITTLVDFNRKWKDLLESDTPVPTPTNDSNADKTGVYEGGGYLAKGIYRPKQHCMMRDYAPFCPACSRAITQMINFLADKPAR